MVHTGNSQDAMGTIWTGECMHIAYTQHLRSTHMCGYCIPDARHVYLPVALGGICGWFMEWEEKNIHEENWSTVQLCSSQNARLFSQAVHRSVVHC